MTTIIRDFNRLERGLDRRAWNSLFREDSEFAMDLSEMVTQGATANEIYSFVDGYTYSPDLARFIKSAAKHLISQRKAAQ